MLTLTNLHFVGYSIIFVTVSFWASVFILPLLVLSFIFSGFVVLFTGLSYASFRLASAKYNSVVLFLNKLLRKFADRIPPSVGFIEVPKKPVKLPTLSSLNIKTGITTLNDYIKSFSHKKLPKAKTDDKFKVKQVNLLSQPTQVIYDENTMLENQLVEPIILPVIYDDTNNISTSADPVKSSELNTS